MASDLEMQWVSRAWTMLRDSAHIERRNSKNPYRDFEGLEDSNLCWPGYRGGEFRRGEGVLVIANVHRDFRSAGLANDPNGVVADLVRATVALQRTAIADDQAEEYLAAARPAYEIGLGPTGWTVARDINRVYAAALLQDGGSRRRMAYVNVSCGQFPERTRGEPYPISESEASSIKSKMRTCCNRAHPVADVVRLLEPSVVVCMSAPGYDNLRRTGLVTKVPTVYFHQRASRGLRLLRDVTLGDVRCSSGDGPETWLDALTRHIHGTQ